MPLATQVHAEAHQGGAIRGPVQQGEEAAALPLLSTCGSRLGRQPLAACCPPPPPLLQLRNQSIFEASGLALINQSYYVVFDSSESIGYLDDGEGGEGTEHGTARRAAPPPGACAAAAAMRARCKPAQPAAGVPVC